MKPLILIAYGTKHGSTREVGEVLADVLAEHGLEVEALPAWQVQDIAQYAGQMIVVRDGLVTKDQRIRDRRNAVAELADMPPIEEQVEEHTL